MTPVNLFTSGKHRMIQKMLTFLSFDLTLKNIIHIKYQYFTVEQMIITNYIASLLFPQTKYSKQKIFNIFPLSRFQNVSCSKIFQTKHLKKRFKFYYCFTFKQDIKKKNVEKKFGSLALISAI